MTIFSWWPIIIRQKDWKDGVLFVTIWREILSSSPNYIFSILSPDIEELLLENIFCVYYIVPLQKRI